MGRPLDRALAIGLRREGLERRLEIALGVDQEGCGGNYLVTLIDSIQHFHITGAPAPKLDRTRLKAALALGDEHNLTGAALFEPGGCIRCGGSGYHGRIGLYEVMPITDEIRTLALERCSVDELHGAAVAHGMRTMRDDGIEKVRQGLTTLTEIARVSRSL